MKILSKQIALYAIFFTLYTIAFRFLLSYSLNIEMYSVIWIYAVLYAVLIFFTAWQLGKSESLRSFIFDAGLKIHTVTYLIWGIISEAWFLLGFASGKESASVVHITLIFWGLGLILHIVIFLVLRKNTIRGIQKSEIFE